MRPDAAPIYDLTSARTEAPTVHHFVLVRNDPASGNPPSVLGVFRRVDQHQVEQVGILHIVDAEVDPRTLGDQVCAMFDRELRGRLS